MSNSTFTPTTLTVPAAAVSGTGQGELNVVTNPSAATDLTGWTASVPANASRQATGSPLDPVVATGFQLTSTGVGQTLTASALTVPTSLRNRKLKLEFYMTQATAAFKVDVLNSSGVRFALTTDVSGASNLPALSSSGKYTTYFDMDSGSTISVRFTSILATGTLSFTQVIVGPGIQPQGLAGQYLGQLSLTPANFGTVSAARFDAWRVGSRLRVVARFNNGTSTASAASLALPSGYTIDSSALPTSTQSVGTYVALRTTTASIYSTNAAGVVFYDGSDTSNLYFATNSGAVSGTLNKDTGGTVAFTNGAMDITFEIPIAQWAGSGTVQLAQNDVEFASNDGSGGTAANTAYNTGMVYGPAGSNIPAVASITGGYQTTSYKVAFQTPIQVSDILQLEMLSPGKSWTPVANSVFAPSIRGTGYRSGIIIDPIDATSVYVSFGNGGAYSNNATFDAAGVAWSTQTSVKWRVRKSSAGAAVGFGIVQPGTSAGLVSASGLPGNTTGNPIASGYVGELSSSFNRVVAGVSTGSGNVGATLTLPAGIFLIVGTCGAGGGSGMSFSSVGITATGTGLTTLSAPSQKYSVSGTSAVGFGTYMGLVNSVGTSIQFTYSLTGSSVDMSVNGYYIRIA